ncbi:hypothetical protein AAFF_G00080450 [Aldrovandia affinis]|uniref:Uncharacterized protein n=1 Tax=Aldrovandia affinis TaxID=143900 RepID=A0AAD7T405_9TELE|nr:hypothetical protein AAFF_G00080450 [Aldrovandia affinis]
MCIWSYFLSCWTFFKQLKERLALLQREYNRTVERLQRAERTEAVRNHVRSKIAEQNLCQKGPDCGRLPEPNEAKERRPCPVHQDPENQNSSPAVRFSLPHDVFSPCASPTVTAGSSGSSRLSGSPSQQSGSPATAQGLRRSSAHRLRSRRSWLRWERTDTGFSDTENSEDGRDPAVDGERQGKGSTALHFSAGTSPSEAVPKPAVGCSGVAGPCGPAVGGADTEVVLTRHEVPENIPAHWAGHGSNRRVVCDSSSQLHSEVPLLDSRTAPVLEPPEKNKSSLTAATPSPLDAAGAHSRLVTGASVLEPGPPAEESRQSNSSPPAPVPDPREQGV